MKTRFFFILSSAYLLTAFPCLHAVTLNWSTGTAGDASGAWSGSASTFNGQIYTAADDLFIDGSATKTITLSGAITAPLSLTISGTGTTGTTVTSSAGVPGAGAITLTGTSLGGTLNKTGTADLILASANTFGAVTLGSGKFFLNNAAGLGTTGTLTVNSGAASGVSASYQTGTVPGNGTPDKFFYDSTNINADYTFSKNLSFGTVASATSYGMAMRGGVSRTTTLSGNISGASNLTLWLDTSASGDATSIWRLQGDNSGFAGTFRLNRGRLFLDNANASGTGALFIQSNGGAGTTGGIAGGGNGGTLVFGFSGTINNTTITLNSGGSGANFINTQANDVTITGSITTGTLGLAKMGSGKLTLTNTANAISTNATTIANGTLSIGGAGRLNSGSYSGAISLFAAASVFEYASSVGQALSGVISGLGSLKKSGSGTLTVGGASNSTFSGGTTLTSGTLRVQNNDTALGSGTFTATTDTLNGSVTVTLATASGGGARALANNIAITNNGSGTTTLNTDGGFFALTLNGIISGNGNFTTTSSGTVTLGGVNTYMGTTTVAGTNTLRIAGSGQLGSGNYANTISIGTGTTFDYASAADQTLGGVISGAGALTKTTGSSTLTFSNTNTYSGTTLVSAGTLALSSTGTTGTGAVSVQSGGTILGTGLVRGSSFTAQSSSLVHVGNGTAQSDYGTLTFTPASGSGSFDFQSDSSTVLGINPSSSGDLLIFNGLSSGTLLFNGDLQVTADNYVPVSIETFNLLDWSNLTTVTFNSRFTAAAYSGYLLGNGDDNQGFDLPDIAGTGYGWDISQFTTNGTISVVVVPEPGRVLLMMLGMAGLALRRPRRA